MENTMWGIILATIAGLSTMVGIFVIFTKKKSNKIIAASLSFASGVMLSVSLIDLLPESFELLNNRYPLFLTVFSIFLFITIGIIFSMLIDKYLPDTTNSNNLYRVGLISMLAIILHNIPEDYIQYATP